MGMSKTKKAKARILRYLRAIRANEIFYGSILASYVNDSLGTNMQDGTILRYARSLRQDGEVNYKCVYKPDGKYVKL